MENHIMKLVKGWWMPDHEEDLIKHPWDPEEGYQPRQRRWALQGLAQGGQALDVGAHVGLWARYLCEHFDAVTAYEPHPEHRQCLERNVTAGNLTIRPVAVGEQQAMIALEHHEGRSGHTQRRREQLGTIPLIRLDDEGLEAVSFIKIDVEGWEYEVLVGAEHLIKTQRPRICLEQKPHEHPGRQGRYRARDLLLTWGLKTLQHHGDDWVMQ
jgi:FkbM family methyltransferase